MKTMELRKKVIDEINNIDNDQLLLHLYGFLSSENQVNDVYKLNDAQNLVINEAREQYEKGDVFSDESVNEEMDQWLNE
jgi:hypothetical protein